jgi:hypothetical protein
MSNDLSLRFPELIRAIDGVLIAGHGQRHWLSPNHPPLDASLADAVAHYGTPSPRLDLWMMCAALERLERTWKGDVEYVRAKVEP